MPVIIETKDGSHSLLNEELNETYHSVHGALQESIYVFIEQGLKFVVPTNEPIKILEVGFGTGLNALLTLKYAQEHSIRINYTTLEAFPLPKDIWQQLNYTASVGHVENFQTLHESNWEVPIQLTNAFTLVKHKTTLQAVALPLQEYDIVYFDAFAPSKQPEMWTLDVLSKTVALLKDRGIFVTYCAKGQLKRDLASLGLTVETLPGPPGKKEMVRAVKP